MPAGSERSRKTIRSPAGRSCMRRWPAGCRRCVGRIYPPGRCRPCHPRCHRNARGQPRIGFYICNYKDYRPWGQRLHLTDLLNFPVFAVLTRISYILCIDQVPYLLNSGSPLRQSGSANNFFSGLIRGIFVKIHITAYSEYLYKSFDFFKDFARAVPIIVLASKNTEFKAKN